jgi:hypothetical protein
VANIDPQLPLRAQLSASHGALKGNLRLAHAAYARSLDDFFTSVIRVLPIPFLRGILRRRLKEKFNEIRDGDGLHLLQQAAIDYGRGNNAYGLVEGMWMRIVLDASIHQLRLDFETTEALDQASIETVTQLLQVTPQWLEEEALLDKDEVAGVIMRLRAFHLL